MKLNIRYFASIREQLGITQETIDIDVPELSIDALRATLAARPGRAHVLSGVPPPRRQRSEQYLTCSQSRAHLRRHSKGRPQR